MTLEELQNLYENLQKTSVSTKYNLSDKSQDLGVLKTYLDTVKERDEQTQDDSDDELEEMKNTDDIIIGMNREAETQAQTQNEVDEQTTNNNFLNVLNNILNNPETSFIPAINPEIETTTTEQDPEIPTTTEQEPEIPNDIIKIIS